MTELHFITHLSNLESITRYGILCNRLAKEIPHTSIADEEVQHRRRDKRVPGGLWLHDYANTYFDARNPMMYRRKEHRRELVVIRINPAALDTPQAVIADGNAASHVTRFGPSPQALDMLDERRVYAEWWTKTDDWAVREEQKRAKCAELLVPHRVPPDLLTGYYVHGTSALHACRQAAPTLEAAVRTHVFFD